MNDAGRTHTRPTRAPTHPGLGGGGLGASDRGLSIMDSAYARQIEEQRQIARQISQSATNLSGCNFGRVAKLLWPFKTAAHIATIAKTTPRTAERYLSGEFPPPYAVVEATMHEIFGAR